MFLAYNCWELETYVHTVGTSNSSLKPPGEFSQILRHFRKAICSSHAT
jgi:hypothetical protein